MDAALRALAEPRRRMILSLVSERELPAGEIARRFDVTRPAISQHLAVLRDAGLVTERRDGVRRLYRARPAGTAELRAWLEAFWDDGLRRLKDVAEAVETASPKQAPTATKEDPR
jgi:DNA-binding transcriptional ArsR family regulator